MSTRRHCIEQGEEAVRATYPTHNTVDIEETGHYDAIASILHWADSIG